MTKATDRLEVRNRDTADCPCSFVNMDPDIHDRLLSVESLPPLEAIRLVGELAMCETYEGFEPGGFSLFVAQHNWTNPAAVGYLTILLNCLSEGCRC